MVVIVIKPIKGRLSMEAKLCGENGGVLTEPKVVHVRMFLKVKKARGLHLNN